MKTLLSSHERRACIFWGSMHGFTGWPRATGYSQHEQLPSVIPQSYNSCLIVQVLTHVHLNRIQYHYISHMRHRIWKLIPFISQPEHPPALVDICPPRQHPVSRLCLSLVSKPDRRRAGRGRPDQADRQQVHEHHLAACRPAHCQLPWSCQDCLFRECQSPALIIAYVGMCKKRTSRSVACFVITCEVFEIHVFYPGDPDVFLFLVLCRCPLHIGRCRQG